MAIIRMLFSLLNNPRVIEKLAESRPIRRAAQITAYALTKAQIAGRDASERVLKSSTQRIPRDQGDMGTHFRRVIQTFFKEIKEGWRDGSRQIKK
ncbi:protein NCBP2AS2-like [Polymixia lowei]